MELSSVVRPRISRSCHSSLGQGLFLGGSVEDVRIRSAAPAFEEAAIRRRFLETKIGGDFFDQFALLSTYEGVALAKFKQPRLGRHPKSLEEVKAQALRADPCPLRQGSHSIARASGKTFPIRYPIQTAAHTQSVQGCVTLIDTFRFVPIFQKSDLFLERASVPPASGAI